MQARQFVSGAVVAGCLAAAGCASAPITSGTSGTPDRPRYSLVFDVPSDRRDFSRIDIVAPELKRFFDPTRDVYVLDTGANPRNIEFASGATFRWDRRPEEIAQEAVRSELERSDWVASVRTVPSGERPDWVLHLNLIEFHYLRTETAFFPQVNVEVLLVDPARRETVAKFHARVINEYSLGAAAGQQRQNTYLVEDWLEPDLREEMRRALERVGEKVATRADEFFADRAAGKPLRPLEP